MSECKTCKPCPKTEARLMAEEMIMDAACAICHWPYVYDDEDQMLEERCESCPAAVAVAAALDAVYREGAST